MTRAPLAEEIAAVCAICRDIGLGEVAPTLLKAAHHSALLLAPQAVVARVQSAEPPGTAGPRAAREVAVARHLDRRGAPVVPPYATFAGPHVTGRSVVTLWPYHAHERTGDERDVGLAATTLDAVHAALRDYDGELPPYTDALDRCWQELVAGWASTALAADDRALLRAHFRRLRDEIDTAATDQMPLHGDAHPGNLLVTQGTCVWTDFEDVCRGPREYDIACLPTTAWACFGDTDPALIARCANLKSVSVAIWCAAEAGRSAAMREAADYHLGRVRRMNALTA